MSQALETAFAMDAASIKFGFGVTAELGFEMRRLGCQKGDGVDGPIATRIYGTYDCLWSRCGMRALSAWSMRM